MNKIFLEAFDPIIIEEYKQLLLNPFKCSSYIVPGIRLTENFTLPWEIDQIISLKINSNETVEFKFLIDDDKYHILYPMFGIYLHILLEFTDGNLELVKNKIKITHEFDKRYHNSIPYLKTVIRSINEDRDLNQMIYELNPISEHLIMLSNIYYLLKPYTTNETNRIDNLVLSLKLYCKFHHNLLDIKYEDVKNKKFYINETVKVRIKDEYMYYEFINYNIKSILTEPLINRLLYSRNNFLKILNYENTWIEIPLKINNLYEHL